MALKKPKKDKKEAAPAEKKAGGPSLLVMFAMMMAVFIVGAGMVIGFYNFFGPGMDKQAEEKKKEKEVILTSLDLGDMVVNLADPGGSRFLKTKITIEFPESKENETLIEEKKPQLTEAILLTLRTKTYSDVSPPDATENLKGELLKAINGRLNEDIVKRIYFTEYLVN